MKVDRVPAQRDRGADKEVKKRRDKNPADQQLYSNIRMSSSRKVWVAEAGYCSDTMYEDKLKEKELQHKRLQQALSAYGYEVIAVPIILGFYGTIFTTTVQSAQTLGVERVRVNRLMNALHAHAITSLHTIVKLRRKLERSPANRRRTYLRHRADPP